MATYFAPFSNPSSTSVTSKTISSTTSASSSSSTSMRRTSKEEQSKSRKISGRSNSFNNNVAKDGSGQKGVQVRRRSSQMNRAATTLQQHDQSGESTKTTMVMRLHSGAARKLSVTSNAGAGTQVQYSQFIAIVSLHSADIKSYQSISIFPITRLLNS